MGVSGEGDRSVEEEDIDDPGNDGDGCSTLCNIIMKFTLFLTNFIIWVSQSLLPNNNYRVMVYILTMILRCMQLLGAGLLALGIYIQIDESTTSVNFQQVRLCIEQLFKRRRLIMNFKTFSGIYEFEQSFEQPFDCYHCHRSYSLYHWLLRMFWSTARDSLPTHHCTLTHSISS